MTEPTGVTAPSASAKSEDWTRGGGKIVVQRCNACLHVWYFERGFCPGCGKSAPDSLIANGLGVVHASTLVHRAPSDEFRALAPYRILLVDLSEGVRVMAHGDSSLAIGDTVRGEIRRIAGRAMPYFAKDGSSVNAS